ncbi:MAG: hypothetical protein RJA34_2057 [Pseudomonadota bacterium]
MKIFPSPASLVLPLVLFCSISEGNALTLGRARGSALLGQGLDITVVAQFSPEEEASSSCFEAEVFYGDSRQESGKVSVKVQPLDGSQSLSLRIQSEAKVDEPVVTVYLKANCNQKTSRKYVLLADLPSDPAAAIASVRAPSVLSSAPVTRGDASSGAANSSTMGSAGEIAGGQMQPVAKSSGNKAKSRSASANTSSGASKARDGTVSLKTSKRSRLKLTPMDGLTDHDPVLKSTAELLTSPVEDLQKRIEALATWRALNASAQDVLRDEARMQSLESGLKNLTDVTAKNRQSLEEVGNRLAEAEAQRYANPVVYGLIAALLACFAGLAFLWNRRPGAVERAPWWGADSAQESLYEPNAAKQGSIPKVAAFGDGGAIAHEVSLPTPPVLGNPLSVQSVDIDLELGEELDAADTADTQLPSSSLSSAFSRDSDYTSVNRRDFSHSISGALRSVNTKEMLDIRQQAEFFMALGRHDEAVAVLESGIANGANANPLVYLDLLKLFHTLSRKSDFDKYREQFNKLFTGLVPVYTSFHLGGNALEAYPQVCTQIAEMWPSPSQTIEYIEFCLVRTASDAPDQGFDLEAYRELLLLDAIAKQLEAPNVTTVAPFSTSGAPAAMADSVSDNGPNRFGTPSTVPVPVAVSPMAAASPADSVDLDLSELGGNLIDFDISNYEKSAADDAADSIPNFNVGASDEPAGRPG